MQLTYRPPYNLKAKTLIKGKTLKGIPLKGYRRNRPFRVVWGGEHAD